MQKIKYEEKQQALKRQSEAKGRGKSLVPKFELKDLKEPGSGKWALKQGLAKIMSQNKFSKLLKAEVEGVDMTLGVDTGIVLRGGVAVGASDAMFGAPHGLQVPSESTDPEEVAAVERDVHLGLADARRSYCCRRRCACRGA